jgi:predicted RNA binding protein YcfA (HicA-like mRNA interferase family)
LTYVTLRVILKERRNIVPLTPKQMIKLLKKNGFVEVSQNGSHIKMRNNTNGIQVIIPYHSKTMKKGLEEAILKQTGLKKERR